MATRLDLVFLWHMHQPDYRAPGSGEFELPWTCLHALKDYTDMAAHLERHPALRAVVNFVPVLLDQLEDYSSQLAAGSPRDPLLRLLTTARPETLGAAERRLILTACRRVNRERMIDPFPAHRRLHDLLALAEETQGEPPPYLAGSFYTDLLCWYFLVWTGESVRRDEPLVATLMCRGGHYTAEERQALCSLIGRLLAALVPRYRALAARGQVELSCTPHGHPLAPLLLSFDSAREAQPAVLLPGVQNYPDGAARLDRHLSLARDSHTRRFGQPPAGMWPAEGGVSAAALARFAAHDVRWVATGEAVLVHTLAAAGQPYRREAQLYRPWREASGLTVCFRDDRLSDLIGFEYSRWHGQDAARHFVGELTRLLESAADDAPPLVCVMLDGENAWEYYPYNAWFFFEELYALLDTHPAIRTCTLSGALAAREGTSQTLPPLVAGSWVNGTLATWIGDADKNRAWELLVPAKAAFDEVMARGLLDPAREAEAHTLLLRLEASDWFWWLGDYNPAEAVASFETLFRRNLEALYHVLGVPAPSALAQPLSRGAGAPETGGTMRRADAG